MLRADLTAPRKQRHTATRTLARLVEGHQGTGLSCSTLRAYVADQRTMYRVPHTLACLLLGVSLSWFYKWITPDPDTIGAAPRPATAMAVPIGRLGTASRNAPRERCLDKSGRSRRHRRRPK